jgi:hypothetical protein
MSPVREIELAFAAEAAAHAAAALDLNPFGEAEALELGQARAVYSGQWSPVHGAIGLGLDGPVEERDLREIERFFFRKERPAAYWVTPATDPSLAALLGRDFAPVRTVKVHGCAPAAAAAELPGPAGASRDVDHKAWTLAFTRLLDPAAQEPGLLALTKLHQKETRFYATANSASYTFFHAGVALVPAAGAHSLLALQAREAAEFRAPFFATGPSPLPFLYERTLYERH